MRAVVSGFDAESTGAAANVRASHAACVRAVAPRTRGRLGHARSAALSLLALLPCAAGAACASETAPPAVFDARHADGRITRTLASLLDEAVLADGEDVRVILLGQDAHASHHLVVLRAREPLHRHDVHEFHVVILRGYGTMQIGDVVVPAGEGSVMYVPRATVHAFANTSPMPAVALVTYTPPLSAPDRVLVEPPADTGAAAPRAGGSD
jgi:mannose-6-phosphate isomerase-like protein (cupin superfamily)